MYTLINLFIACIIAYVSHQHIASAIHIISGMLSSRGLRRRSRTVARAPLHRPPPKGDPKRAIRPNKTSKSHVYSTPLFYSTQ